MPDILALMVKRSVRDICFFTGYGISIEHHKWVSITIGLAWSSMRGELMLHLKVSPVLAFCNDKHVKLVYSQLGACPIMLSYPPIPYREYCFDKNVISGTLNTLGYTSELGRGE